MRKIALTMLFATLVVAEGVAAQSPFIKEILRTSKAERFKPADISELIVKLIPAGSSSHDVERLLSDNGFKTAFEARTLAACDGCDNNTLTAYYTETRGYSLLPDKSYISVAIGFRRNATARVVASHNINVY